MVSFRDDAHRFLYLENDADRLLYRARFMMVLLGVLLGALVYGWVLEWLGFLPAVAALVMVALEPNLVAHFSLISPDAGLAVFVFAAAYAAWRLYRRVNAVNIVALCVSCALAVSTTYSGSLLLPVVILLLAAAVYPCRRVRVVQAIVIVLLLLAASYNGLWAAFRFDYVPSPNNGWLFAFHENAYVQERAPAAASIAGWVDGQRLLPNAFSQGWLLDHAAVRRERAFLAGRFSDAGWWFYFPAALLLKTPLALLLLAGCGVVMLLVRWRRDMPVLLCAGLVPLSFFGLAMATGPNTGVRHVLSVFPFLILIAALPIARLLSIGAGRGRAVVACFAVLWLFEYGRAYPSPLAFFNSAAGGPDQGARYLTDSNVDWGQDLKPLSTWMGERDIHDMNLAYAGSAEPAYYGMQVTYLAGSPFFVAPGDVRLPRLPGYVAVSKTVLNGVGLDESGRDFYRPLQDREPAAVIGHSINVYWVDEPWW